MTTSRSLTLALAGALFALAGSACCSPRAAPAPPTPLPEDAAVTDDPSWRSLPVTPGCAEALAALRDGAFADWRGLAGCGRRELEDAFGPSEAFTGVLGPGRRHLPADSAPFGVQVGYAGATVLAVAVQPRWTAEALAALGPADDDIPSGFGPEYHQLTWTERGLIAHVAHVGSQVWLAVGFAPVPLDALATSPLYRLGVRERVAP